MYVSRRQPSRWATQLVLSGLFIWSRSIRMRYRLVGTVIAISSIRSGANILSSTPFIVASSRSSLYGLLFRP